MTIDLLYPIQELYFMPKQKPFVIITSITLSVLFVSILLWLFVFHTKDRERGVSSNDMVLREKNEQFHNYVLGRVLHIDSDTKFSVNLGDHTVLVRLPTKECLKHLLDDEIGRSLAEGDVVMIPISENASQTDSIVVSEVIVQPKSLNPRVKK